MKSLTQFLKEGASSYMTVKRSNNPKYQSEVYYKGVSSTIIAFLKKASNGIQVYTPMGTFKKTFPTQNDALDYIQKETRYGAFSESVVKESYDPMSLDYSNKNISKKELLDIIRHFKSINKIDFYKFVGKVNGKKTVIKGMGDWFQTFVVDGKTLNMPMGKSERTLIQYLDIAYGK